MATSSIGVNGSGAAGRPSTTSDRCPCPRVEGLPHHRPGREPDDHRRGEAVEVGGRAQHRLGAAGEPHQGQGPCRRRRPPRPATPPATRSGLERDLDRSSGRPGAPKSATTTPGPHGSPDAAAIGDIESSPPSEPPTTTTDERRRRRATSGPGSEAPARRGRARARDLVRARTPSPAPTAARCAEAPTGHGDLDPDRDRSPRRQEEVGLTVLGPLRRPDRRPKGRRPAHEPDRRCLRLRRVDEPVGDEPGGAVNQRRFITSTRVTVTRTSSPVGQPLDPDGAGARRSGISSGTTRRDAVGGRADRPHPDEARDRDGGRRRARRRPACPARSPRWRGRRRP